MLLFRSLLFYTGILLALVLVNFYIMIAFLFPYALRYRILTLWARFCIWWLGITCNLHYRVEGLEHIPAGTMVIMAKHQSAWETLAFQIFLPRQTWVLKRSLLSIPLLGWGLRALRSIGIDRTAGKKALKQVVEQGSERLHNGTSIVIFPEGTRTLPGTKHKYNAGGALLAQQSGAPVLPVAHNAGEFWSRNSIIKRPGTITVRIGPAITAEGKKAAEILRQTEDWIEGQMAEISTPNKADGNHHAS